MLCFIERTKLSKRTAIGKEDQILSSIQGQGQGQGYLPGNNRRGKRKMNWIDNINNWTDGGLEMTREIVRKRQRQEEDEEF